jgi:hypothetical protein
MDTTYHEPILRKIKWLLTRYKRKIMMKYLNTISKVICYLLIERRKGYQLITETGKKQFPSMNASVFIWDMKYPNKNNVTEFIKHNRKELLK